MQKYMLLLLTRDVVFKFSPLRLMSVFWFSVHLCLHLSQLEVEWTAQTSQNHNLHTSLFLH